MDGDWALYWRSADRPVEAMRAHFERHTYHRHSHETYSFGVTESGAQAFTCRGAARTSAAGMVMAFNPDEPHDGHTAVPQGFTYLMVHIGPSLLSDVLADGADRAVGLPLFADPVLTDPALAGALRRLHGALRADSRLAQDEALAATVRALVRRGAKSGLGLRDVDDAPGRRDFQGRRDLRGGRDLRDGRGGRDFRGIGDGRGGRDLWDIGDVRGGRGRVVPAGIGLVRDRLHADFREHRGAAELAELAGCSRFALHRGFLAAYGLAPSDYQRQLRLREARRLLAAGVAPAHVAAEVGFADQSHLTRWFSRYYGITPAVFRG